jgi:hypothetical protein
MYQEAYEEARARRDEMERSRKDTRGIAGFIHYLSRRIDALREAGWIDFFSDRGVLPGYAFPIYNVSLATVDAELKLERDLRLAMSEYAPGASIVAKGRLWRSVGIRMPPRNNALERKHYAVCPRCWHVEHDLDKDKVFREAACPVCGHDGARPLRRKFQYIVPAFGFTTDLQTQGEELSFDRPMRIPASRVLFVPQKDEDDPVQVALTGAGGLSVEVRTTENADFFVFNDGDDPAGRGFFLCRSCGLQLDVPTQKEKAKEHRSPMGRTCKGLGEWVHLGHDFRGCAARLAFGGTGRPYDDQSFWMSLLHALLGGMSDALGIEPSDINGVIRPIRQEGGNIIQEIVLFDDVPGGAGHVQRLEDQGELLAVLEAAHARVAQCGGCDPSASCYRCLRSYRNQLSHDLLIRQPVAEYLDRLRSALGRDPDADQPYPLSDRANALRAALRNAARAYVVADRLTAEGPEETGPWYILLQDLAARRTELTLAVRYAGPADRTRPAARLPLLAVQQAGATLRQVRDDAPPPPFGLLAVGGDGRMTAFHWGETTKVASLDGETHRLSLWYNRSARRLAGTDREMDRWIEEATVPLSIRDIVPEGYKIYTVAQGTKVNFTSIFRSATRAPIRDVVLQDPYLTSYHHLKCLKDFLRAVPWRPADKVIPFRLVTHLSEPEPSAKQAIPTPQHRGELNQAFAAHPALAPEILLARRFPRPLHMRYVVMTLADGRRLLYLLERGLDIEDPKTGAARQDTYVLEFQEVPAEIAPLLGLSS